VRPPGSDTKRIGQTGTPDVQTARFTCPSFNGAFRQKRRALSVTPSACTRAHVAVAVRWLPLLGALGRQRPAARDRIICGGGAAACGAGRRSDANGLRQVHAGGRASALAVRRGVMEAGRDHDGMAMPEQRS